MQRKLSDAEKQQIRGERLKAEMDAFPNADIDVIVETETYANGEPKVRVIKRGTRRTDTTRT